MTYEEMLNLARHPSSRAKSRDEEHRLQAACVRWFRAKYPKHRHLLFAVPNGGRRDAVTGSRLKDEGVTAGVADLILLLPSRFYGSLCIEMKTRSGRQQDTQRQWQQAVEQAGNKYVLCRSLDDFMHAVTNYMNSL